MDFYKSKIAAIKEIDEMFAEGVEHRIIVFKIETKYAFSKKMIMGRIDELEYLKSKHYTEQEEPKTI